ncbi:AAA family ATPase [Thalassotalea sp. PLHSN55]|uniref:AAA family ATPase n=1 Tax=Thalassotalea sp. PLHSN55 TaxID=3435888 RepID=UPI003F82FAD3
MQNKVAAILAQMNQAVLGKEHEIRLALVCLLAKGHLLIEDLPGMGKTTLAHALATTLGLSYQRSQFTSDLLPADIIGVSIFDPKAQSFTLHRGPIFNQVLLADEINRASPKTQSALLEAMEEKQVSIDGETYPLTSPFFVIATQNPLFHAGTYPLPESQLDRFMMRISLGFPCIDAERDILRAGSSTDANLSACVNAQEFQQLQQATEQVSASDSILDYIIGLCHASRAQSCQANPLSPRAGKALLAAAKAWAFIDNRNHLIPDDVQAVFEAVCEHRLDAGHQQQLSSSIAQTLLADVDVMQPL